MGELTSMQQAGAGTNQNKCAIFGWGQVCAWAVALCLAAAPAAAQQTAPPSPQKPPSSASQSSPAPDSSKAPSRITPEQAKQLFSLVDELIKFSSDETGLPIKDKVKRQLTTRTAVESYLEEKFNEDQDAKRLQRDEIVLKKFGLLDRDFALKPFLLALLKEQIEAYYDSKTKTVNMLDWVDIDEQKPVLAHELTHALQDQHSDLEKWDDQTPDDVSVDSAGDTDHLAKDEMDTARDAVAEGQATAIMMDYILKPLGKSLVKDPEVMDILKQQMNGSENSPVMARAPLLLSESMLFPYREGLSFEQDLWMDQGQAAAFSGALDHPPTSSWEIINPREYEKHHIPAVPLLPDIHPLVDKLYQPYDIGQVGQLDVHILTELFGGDEASRNLTPAWKGGLYWAGQLRSAKTPADQGTTKSLALFYLAAWRNSASAQAFAKLYADSLGRKYSGLKEDVAAHASAPNDGRSAEQVFSTTEGPVVITTRGRLVFISESFSLDMARKLTALILDAQGAGEMKMAQTSRPAGLPIQSDSPDFASQARQPLTGNLVHLLSNCGVMKAVIDAEMRSAVRLK
ncbi:MAG TPA: hypothetical protein VGT08_12505 [Terracidiphilus sp.]|nr:hypothetical protein [Terracidiphilus sp.]